MYESFYGLTKAPFTTVPDPNSLYWSSGHSQAFAMLQYGVLSRAPITVITGEVGAGKTALVRHLLNDIPEELTLGMVSNMIEGRGELLDWVMMSLGQPFGTGSYVQMFKQFQDFVVQRYAEGRRVLLVIDEAQNLGPAALEELRLLTNINSGSDELLQLILAGQPLLRALLSRPELVQFAQRISADYHLSRMHADETPEYIAARLQLAGAKWPIFTPGACNLVHEATGGLPRLINVVCDLALVYGYADEARIIDNDLLFEFLETARERRVYGQLGPVEKPLMLVPEMRVEPDVPARRADRMKD